MNKEQIKEMIILHHLWLEGDKNGERAIFRGANLEGANFEGANLRGADLRGADFRGANCKWAIFRGADLRGANFEGANLRGANLRGADFEGAFLRGANLEGTNLRGANFEGANFEGAYLSNCIGNNREIKTLQLGTYITVLTEDIIFVGCQSMLVKDLDSITIDTLLDMGGQKAVNWWAKWGEMIKMILEKEKV